MTYVMTKRIFGTFKKEEIMTNNCVSDAVVGGNRDQSAFYKYRLFMIVMLSLYSNADNRVPSYQTSYDSFYLCLSWADVNEYRLVRDLLKSYDKRIRPSLNASHALNVTFGFSLSQIIDVDEKNQILTTNCWLNQMWIDYGLRWKPEKYGGLKVVRLPFELIWKPDILLYNNADVATHFSSISSNVIVTNDGNVTWLSMVIFKSSCAINVRYFPFDFQNCSMQFASWTYDGFQVNLVLTTNEGDISNYIANSEWDLLKLYVERNVVYYSCCVEPYPDITFYIYIKRRPLFYIFNMFLPCILITLVALLGFYIPSDSGEKVTMGITTLLSMTVFMMLVAENMPPTSNVLPLIGIYYGITIFIVSTATGMTVFTLNIHHKGYRGREVPYMLRKICFGIFSKIFCMPLQKPTHLNHTKESQTTYTPSQGDGQYIRFKLATDQDTSTRQAESNTNSNSNTSPDYKMNHVHDRTLFGVKIRPDRSNTCNGYGPPVGSHNCLHHTQGQQTTSFSAAPPPIYDDKDVVNSQNFESYFMRVLEKVSATIEQNERRLAEQDERENIKLEWQHVARIIDRILMTIFVVVTLTTTFAIMIQSD